MMSSTLIAHQLQTTIQTMPNRLPLPPSSNHPTARFWDAMDISFWHGFWFHPDLIPPALAFQSTPFPPNTILLASAMKTGTTWLKSLTLSLLTPTADLTSHNPHYLLPTVESASFTTKPFLTNDTSSSRLLHTHLPYSLLPPSLSKVVYIARNPKDTLISSWHFFNSILKPYPLESAVDDFCNGVFQYGPFFDHVAEYWVASRDQPEKVLFLKYEEMKRDTKREVLRIGEFLGKEEGEEEVERIVEKCRLEKMKDLEVNRKGESLMNVPNWSYFRKGEVGDWRNYLTLEMEEKIDGVCREKLESVGLFF